MDAAEEMKRVIEITRAQAATARAKPAHLRETFLVTCRANWKTYAATISGNEAECERFAAEIDRATRDLMALEPQPGTPENGTG